MKVYDIGENARLAAIFQNDSATNADPTGVTCTVFRSPLGPTVTYVYGIDTALVKDGVGVYHVDFPITDAGAYWYRFEGTGMVVAQEEECFKVRTRKAV